MTQQVTTFEALYPNIAPNGGSKPRLSCEPHTRSNHYAASCLTSACLP